MILRGRNLVVSATLLSLFLAACSSQPSSSSGNHGKVFVLRGTSTCTSDIPLQTFQDGTLPQYPSLKNVEMSARNGGLIVTLKFERSLPSFMDYGELVMITLQLSSSQSPNASHSKLLDLSIDQANSAKVGWSAHSGSVALNKGKDVSPPEVQGDSVVVVFPKDSLFGWDTQPFYWTAEENVQNLIGSDRGVTFCPVPGNGIDQFGTAHWLETDPVRFPSVSTSSLAVPDSFPSTQSSTTTTMQAPAEVSPPSVAPPDTTQPPMPRMATLDDVRGSEPEVAKAAITGAGFNLSVISVFRDTNAQGNVTDRCASDPELPPGDRGMPSGSIMTQSPPGNEMYPIGTTVVLGICP